MTFLRWSTPDLTLTFALDDGPVRLIAVREASQPDRAESGPSQPLVEVSAVGHGLSPAPTVTSTPVLGQRLRYVRPRRDRDDACASSRRTPATGLRVTSCVRSAGRRTRLVRGLDDRPGHARAHLPVIAGRRPRVGRRRPVLRRQRLDGGEPVVSPSAARDRHWPTSSATAAPPRRQSRARGDQRGLMVDRRAAAGRRSGRVRRTPWAGRSSTTGRGTTRSARPGAAATCCSAGRPTRSTSGRASSPPDDAVHDGAGRRSSPERIATARSPRSPGNAARCGDAAPDRRPDAGGLQRLHEHADGRPDDGEAAAADRRRGRGRGGVLLHRRRLVRRGRLVEHASAPGSRRPRASPNGLARGDRPDPPARHGARPLARARGDRRRLHRSPTNCPTTRSSPARHPGRRDTAATCSTCAPRRPPAPRRHRRPAGRRVRRSATSSSTTTR